MSIHNDRFLRHLSQSSIKKEKKKVRRIQKIYAT